MAAGAGCAVGKHGNRSSTTKCGTADLLEALGVEIEINPDQVARRIEEIVVEPTEFGLASADLDQVAVGASVEKPQP